MPTPVEVVAPAPTEPAAEPAPPTEPAELPEAPPPEPAPLPELPPEDCARTGPASVRARITKVVTRIGSSFLRVNSLGLGRVQLVGPCRPRSLSLTLLFLSLSHSFLSRAPVCVRLLMELYREPLPRYSFTALHRGEGRGCLRVREGLDGEAGRGGREPGRAAAHHRGLRDDAGPDPGPGLRRAGRLRLKADRREA